jgi:hypothetical protein
MHNMVEGWTGMFTFFSLLMQGGGAPLAMNSTSSFPLPFAFLRRAVVSFLFCGCMV